MFKNKKSVSTIVAFISAFVLISPSNFTGAIKRRRLYVGNSLSNNFANKNRKKMLPRSSSGKKIKNLLRRKIAGSNKASLKAQVQNALKRKVQIVNKRKTQKINRNFKEKVQTSEKSVRDIKTLTDISLRTQKQNNVLENAAQTTKEFVNKHKVPVGIICGTTGLFTANRMYNLKKYHKKLPLATKLICSSSPFQLHFLNVGEGDCILVRYNDGNQFHNWLVDAGYNFGFGLTDVTQYLKKLDIKDLNGIVLTHPHPDHYWNLKYVFNEFKVEKFYHSYMDTPVKLIDKINSLNYNTRVTQPKDKFQGDKINVATKISNLNQQPYTLYKHNNFSIKALGPLKKHKDVNDNSIVLLIEYEDKKILLMGDAGIEAERELMNSEYKDTIKNVTMVKIGHHGNNSSSSKEFVKYTNPKIAVCSTGGHFVSFGLLNVHEQPWVMNRWKSCSDGKCEILTTEEQNNIVVYYDNSNRTIKSARLERNAKDLS